MASAPDLSLLKANVIFLFLFFAFAARIVTAELR